MDISTLKHYLRPIDWMLDGRFTDVCIVGAALPSQVPNVFCEDSKGWHPFYISELNPGTLRTLAHLMQPLGGATPLSEQPCIDLMYNDHIRVAVVTHPMLDVHQYAFSFRVLKSNRFTHQQLVEVGVYKRAKPVSSLLLSDNEIIYSDRDKELLALYKEGQLDHFMTLAFSYGFKVMACGNTGSGKTTYLDGLLDLLPDFIRIITIQNAKELRTPRHHNSLHFSFNDIITAEDCVRASLRHRPDYIVPGEVRGTEIAALLWAGNTGHKFVSSIHADSIQNAFSNIVFLMSQTELGRKLSEESLRRYIDNVVDVWVFFDRQYEDVSGGPVSWRGITNIYWNPSRKYKV